MLTLSSLSPTYEVRDISGISEVRAPGTGAGPSVPVVRVGANLGARTYAGPVTSSVEQGLERASGDIYQAYIKAREAKAAQQAAATASQPAAQVSLTGIEAEILGLINQVRAQNGLSQLAVSQVLTDLARLRSNDMVSRNYFSHYTPEGTNIKHMFSQYGVAYKNFGENLGNATPASYGTPQGFLGAWMGSPSHRENMLKGYYTLIGVGVADGGGRRVATVLFIR